MLRRADTKQEFDAASAAEPAVETDEEEDDVDDEHAGGMHKFHVHYADKFDFSRQYGETLALFTMVLAHACVVPAREGSIAKHSGGRGARGKQLLVRGVSAAHDLAWAHARAASCSKQYIR